MNDDFDIKFNEFLEHVVKMISAHQHEINQYKNIMVDDGRRYKKIVVGSAAWCFVDKTTGDVLKPASWKSPAKHARGNIFDAWNGAKWLTVYGPCYLK